MNCAALIRVAACSALLLAPLATGQDVVSAQSPQREEPEVRLPSGRTQREEILREDHKKNLEDAARIQELGKELEAAMRENGFRVLSAEALKKCDEIEKLARRVRGRMRRF